MFSRSQPATRHSAAWASGRARAMNAATGSLRSLPQARSWRKHNPRQCRSPSQPGTEQRFGRSGRRARGGGAASKAAQPIPAVLRARRQPSQRPDVRRVAVGHPGVRHGQAAVRARDQITGEQQRLAVPLTGPPRRIQPRPQPPQPPRPAVGSPLDLAGGDRPQRPPAHR